MAFHGAQAPDVRFSNFNENHPGSSQTNNIIYQVNSGQDSPPLFPFGHHADQPLLFPAEGSEQQSASSAIFGSHDSHFCLEGTRIEILSDIDCWINSEQVITAAIHRQ
jgi:hypothetical protein